MIGACFLIRRELFEAARRVRHPVLALRRRDRPLPPRARRPVARSIVVDGAVRAPRRRREPGEPPALVAEHFERGGERFVADHEGTRRARLVPRWRRRRRFGDPGVRRRDPGRAVRSTATVCAATRVLRSAHPRRSRSTARRRARPSTPSSCARSRHGTRCGGATSSSSASSLAADPQLRVLFVEPPFDWVHDAPARRGRDARGAGCARFVADGRVLALRTGQGRAPRRSGRSPTVRCAARCWRPPPTSASNDPPSGSTTPRTRRSRSHHRLAVASTTSPTTGCWLGGAASAPAARARRTGSSCRSSTRVVVCSPDLARTRRSARARPPRHPERRRPRALRDAAGAAGRPSAAPGGGVRGHAPRGPARRRPRRSRSPSSQPEVQVVLVGPNSLGPMSSARLGAISNVHLLGSRPYAESPATCNTPTSCIVPHVVSPFTESLDPIKAYECLAVGRPTVATPVAGIPRARRTDSRRRSRRIRRHRTRGNRRRIAPPGRVQCPSWTERGREFGACARGGTRDMSRPSDRRPRQPLGPARRRRDRTGAARAGAHPLPTPRAARRRRAGRRPAPRRRTCPWRSSASAEVLRTASAGSLARPGERDQRPVGAQVLAPDRGMDQPVWIRCWCTPTASRRDSSSGSQPGSPGCRSSGTSAIGSAPSTSPDPW